MNFKKLKNLCLKKFSAFKFKFVEFRIERLNSGAIIFYIRKKLSLLMKVKVIQNQKNNKYYVSYQSLTYDTSLSDPKSIDAIDLLNTYLELGDIQQIDECLLYDFIIRNRRKEKDYPYIDSSSSYAK